MAFPRSFYSFSLLLFSLCWVTLASRIRDELGPLLSPNATIVDSEGGDLGAATQRWQMYASPDFDAVVQVTSENDIIETIHYANKYGIPFLAVNAGHGEIKSLGYLQHGIQITIRSLNSIVINGNNTATIGGGANNLDVTTTLWNAKKQTVSGTCECVGFLGPMLGGGHGFLQGSHGMVADNLIQARVVLANGTVVIASATNNPDLLWALRGSGHNFGIVTEVLVNIYDVPSTDTWYYENYVFTGEHAMQVFQHLNQIKSTSPKEFEHYAVFLRMPNVDPVNAIVFFSTLYNGLAADAEQWVAPFRQFSPLSVTKGNATYPQLAGLTGNGVNDAICKNENLNRIRYPIYLDEFDSGAMWNIFSLFNQTTAQYPALNNTLMLFEGLSTQAVKAVDVKTTAFPHRDYFILASPVVTYAPDLQLDGIAQGFGRAMRQNLLNAVPNGELRAYVNYAVGEESLQNIYGYDSWRVPKLQGLKSAYDPGNVFQWYAPVGLPSYGRRSKV